MDNPSEYAEEVFDLLVEDGLKGQNHAPLLERTTDMNVLFVNRDDVTTDDIGIHVDVKMGRDKDQSLPHRVQLAEEVRDIVEDELKTRLGSTESKTSTTSRPLLLLCVRIVLVSDGSSLGRRYTSATGTAKLTVAYCLQDATSGKVGMANQLYATEDCTSPDLDSYWEYSSALVRSMARRLSEDIATQVTSGLEEYKTHRKEKEERLEKIEIKLAKEENLEPDEYAFAAEQHVL